MPDFYGAISWRASLTGNAHSGLLSSAYAAPDATKSGKTRKGRAINTVENAPAAKFFGSKPLPFGTRAFVCVATKGLLMSKTVQAPCELKPRCDRSKWGSMWPR